MATVHQVRVWDFAEDKYVILPLKCTAERITLIRGEIIPGTAEEVEESALDATGRYDPQRDRR